MAVEVGEGLGVIGDHGVEIESLRVGEIGVRNGSRDGGPIGTQPAAEAIGVVACAEVVVAGFGVALLALEFVILRACVGVGALAPVRVEVRVVADDAGVVGEDARGAEKIFDIVCRVAIIRDHCNTLPAEEDIFGEAGVVGISRTIGFGQDFAARAVPVELARKRRRAGAGLGDAAAFAVVDIVRFRKCVKFEAIRKSLKIGEAQG